MLRLGKNLNRRWDAARAEGLLERFAIPLDQPCGRLSGGQQARVAFAVALGSRSDAAPPHGEVVHARHTESQSSFLLRRPPGDDALESGAAQRVDEQWVARPPTLEDLVVAHLSAAKERSA